MISDRWPAGRPAAPQSVFFWHGRDTPEFVAELNKQAAARKTATKAEATKRRRGTSKGTMYGLSRKSDEAMGAQRRKA